jgi:hypothetical protein
MTTSDQMADLAPLALTIDASQAVLPVGRASVTPDLGVALYRHGLSYPRSALFPGGVVGISVPVPLGPALDLLGLEFKRFSAGNLFLQTYSASARQGGANNRSLTLGAGIAYIQGVTLRKGEIATAVVNVMPFSADGDAHPVTPEESQTVLAISSEPALHTIGPVRLEAASLLPGVNTVSIDLAPRVTPLRHGDHRYPVDALYAGGNPVVTLGCDALLAMLDSYALSTAVPTTVEIYGRAGDFASGDLSANGLKLEGSRATLRPQPVDLPLDGHGSQGAALDLLTTDNTHPLAYTATTAIPTA